MHMQDTDIELFEEISLQTEYANEAAADLVAGLVAQGNLTPVEGEKYLRELRRANYKQWRYSTRPIRRRLQNRQSTQSQAQEGDGA
jgi:polyhydroxyalkanoate synthesis regulator phasin